MRIKEITSSSNDFIKQVKKLQTKAKARYEDKLYVVEGFKQIRELEQERIHCIVVSSKEKLISLDMAEDTSVILVSDKIFLDLSQDPSPQGILAVVKMKNYLFDESKLSNQGIYLLIDSIQDPGNLGTIIRVADAVKIDGIFMNMTTVDVYNPKVIKSTMGSLEHVEIVLVESLPELMRTMKDKGIRLFGAYLDESMDHFKADFNVGCGIVIGNEGNGISDEVIACVDQRIKIPMPGKSESLNASIATSVILYEVLRQRGI